MRTMRVIWITTLVILSLSVVTRVTSTAILEQSSMPCDTPGNDASTVRYFPLDCKRFYKCVKKGDTWAVTWHRCSEDEIFVYSRDGCGPGTCNTVAMYTSMVAGEAEGSSEETDTLTIDAEPKPITVADTREEFLAKSPHEDDRCTEVGIIAEVDECQVYYVCKKILGHWSKLKFRCHDNYFFNRIDKACRTGACPYFK